ncbi:MAG: hypothetical protein R2759_17935 [Bacteroidales bacterium]
MNIPILWIWAMASITIPEGYTIDEVPQNAMVQRSTRPVRLFILLLSDGQRQVMSKI